MGLSPQRPLYRAYQEAVQRWRGAQFPAIRAAAKPSAPLSTYFADEAGIRSDYHAGTTWTRTPVVAATGARFSINMISAASARARCG